MRAEAMSDAAAYDDYDKALEQRETQFKRYQVGQRSELLPRAKRLVIMALADARGDCGRLDPLEEWVFEQAAKAVEGLR